MDRNRAGGVAGIGVGIWLGMLSAGLIAAAAAVALPVPPAHAAEPHAGGQGRTVQEMGGDALRDAAVMRVLEQYMDALNALDLEGHVATYHFPHYRHAGGKIAIWQNANEAMPILKVPAAERRAAIRGALEPDWDRSEWTRRDIVQGDDEKVHVVTRFERRRADGSVITAYDSLYVLTFEGGRWAIKGRSSFAP